MLTNRIIRALSFQRDVYAEVEQDTSFTNTAWVLVIVVGFLNQLGTHVSQLGTQPSASFVKLLGGTVIGTVGAVVAFAVAAFAMSWVGRTLFNAEVTFDEVVRTLGLAYVWHVVGFIGVVAAVAPGLICLASPLFILAWLLLILSWFVAVQEALDLEVGQTIVTVVLGWIVFGFIMMIAGWIKGLVGLTAAGIGKLFGF